jgi:hypothetical protein
VQLSIHGLSGGAEHRPFDLVLGESINSGWTASVVGGRSLGTPVLIDGFANGWRIDPSSLGSAVRGGTVSVVLRWHPQSGANLALVVSLLAVVACVLLVFEPWRRWRRRRGADRAGSDTAPARSKTAGRAVPAEVGDGPQLASLFRLPRPPARPWVAVVTGVATGVLAGVVATPLVGLAVGVASAVVLLVPRLRAGLGLLAIAGVAAAGIYTVVVQAVRHVPSGGTWTLSFDVASKLAWAGVVFLVADAVVEVVLQRQATRAPSGPEDPAPGTGR